MTSVKNRLLNPTIHINLHSNPSNDILRGAGQMANCLRALSALPEDQGSHPITHATSHRLTPVPGDLTPSSGLLGYQVHWWCTDKINFKNLSTLRILKLKHHSKRSKPKQRKCELIFFI